MTHTRFTGLLSRKKAVRYLIYLLFVCVFAVFVFKLNQTEKTELVVRTGQTFEKAEVTEIPALGHDMKKTNASAASMPYSANRFVCFIACPSLCHNVHAVFVLFVLNGDAHLIRQADDALSGVLNLALMHTQLVRTARFL